MDTTTDLKFTADRMALLAAARQCALIAPSSSPVRELECVLLEIDSAENRLALSATDLEVALRLTLPIRSSTDGKFSLAINAKFFTAMLEKLGGADVDIALKPGAQLELKSGAAFYRVPALSGERYPSIELPLPEARTEVCGLPELIGHTAFAVSETSAMPLLKCVNLRFTPDGLKAVGSDGLCIAEAAGDIRCTGSVSFLVAASSLSKLSKLCCNEDTLSVGTAGKSLVFLKDGFEFSARLMEGRYADTDRIIRQLSPSFTVLLDSAELRRALLSATAISSDGATVLCFDGDKIEIHSGCKGGSASALVEVVQLTGRASGEYSYSTRRLMRSLRALTGSLTLGLAQHGMLTVSSDNVLYLQSALSARTSEKKTMQQKAA